MKKRFISIGICSLFFMTAALAQPLEPTESAPDVGMDMGGVVTMDQIGSGVGEMVDSVTGAELTYKVYNVSQQNADATSAGARPGDVLRYEFAINSDTNDVVDFVTSLDITDILANTEVVDAGLGNISGGTISFPSFTQQAPCSKMFTFFVRVKECEDGGKAMNSGGHGLSASVDLSCELVQSGPSSQLMWYVISAVIAGFVLVSFANRKTS